MLRPPPTGFTRPLLRSFLSSALFLVTLSASSPERLRSVVVTNSVIVALGLSSAIGPNPYLRGYSRYIPAARSPSASSSRIVAGRGDPEGPGEPVTDALARRAAAVFSSWVRCG